MKKNVWIIILAIYGFVSTVLLAVSSIQCPFCNNNGETAQAPQRHEHNFQMVYVAPTYYSDGYTIETCECGKEEKTVLSDKRPLPLQFIYKSYEVDYLGGVTLYFDVKNISDKVIKYVEFDIIFYNAVGDIITSNLSWNKTYSWKVTGPIETGSQISYNPTGFYNSNFKGDISINNLSIEFMDGTVINVEKEKYDVTKLVE